MSRLTMIGALLCVTLSEARATSLPERTATVVKEVKLPNSYAYTVAIDSHLYTVSNNITHLLVNSTDENVKPCVIDFHEHELQQTIRATVINDKIVVWGIRTKYKTVYGTRMDHTVLIVDPWHCSFKAASTFEEERPRGWFDPFGNIAHVVPHEDSFDVFYPSLQTCAPCRYSIDGKRIDLQRQLKSEVANMRVYFQIQGFSAPGLENGYFYAYKFKPRDETVIQLLDANFRVVKKRNLNHTVDAFAINPASRPGVIVCYMTSPFTHRNGNDTVYCKAFDSDLQILFITRLNMLDGYGPDSVSVTVDAQGDLFISTEQSADKLKNHRRKFVNYQVNSAGKITDVSTVHVLPEDFYGHWNIHGFFSNNTYCAEYNNNDLFIREDTQEFVRCVTIPK